MTSSETFLKKTEKQEARIGWTAEKEKSRKRQQIFKLSFESVEKAKLEPSGKASNVHL